MIFILSNEFKREKIKGFKNEKGIYKITCKENKRVYIGRSVEMRCRALTHINELEKKIHNNKILQHSFNKYGLNSFKFEVIEKIDDEAMLNQREAYWGEYYNAINSFNICPFTSDKSIANEHGNKVLGEKNGKTKLKNKDVEYICYMLNDGKTAASIARKYNVSATAIQSIRIGRTRGNISMNYLNEEIIKEWREDRKEKWTKV